MEILVLIEELREASQVSGRTAINYAPLCCIPKILTEQGELQQVIEQPGEGVVLRRR